MVMVKAKAEWNVKVTYPDGQKVILSSTYAEQLLHAWNEYHPCTKQPTTANERNEILWQAFSGMTLFDGYAGISKL